MVRTLESWQLPEARLEVWPTRDLWRAWSRITGALVARGAREVRVWLERDRQRYQLAALSKALLRDIGLTPEDVRVECAKPFWQE